MKDSVLKKVILHSNTTTVKPLHFKYALLDGVITEIEYEFYFS